MKTVYIETSILSYLTALPSRDVRTAAWQQITSQWWDEERHKYELYISELVLVEASAGDQYAAQRRLAVLQDIPELGLTDAAKKLSLLLLDKGGIPRKAEADAIHVSIACVYSVDYLLTWNFRHIDNATTKPLIRSICSDAGYRCPEICTPIELFAEDGNV